MSTLLERISELATSAAEAEGCALVDVEMTREGRDPVLRVLVERPDEESGADGDDPAGDRPRGLTIDDCTAISRRLSALLEVHDPIPGRYRLELSSPGLNRPLIKMADYVRFNGRQASIRTRRPLDTADGAGTGRKSFKGRLAGVDGEHVLITVGETRYRIPFSAIGKANLEYEFKESGARSGKFNRGVGPS